MAKNKKVLILVLAFALVLLLIGAGWLYFGNASDQNLRVMGFPSLSAVPDGFTLSLIHIYSAGRNPWRYYQSNDTFISAAIQQRKMG